MDRVKPVLEMMKRNGFREARSKIREKDIIAKIDPQQQDSAVEMSEAEIQKTMQEVREDLNRLAMKNIRDIVDPNTYRRELEIVNNNK